MFASLPPPPPLPLPVYSAQLPAAADMTAVCQSMVMADGLRAEQKPRKMRASCDACSRAKVKCDKIRPTCQRCGNMGICCNYSPSMRLGKPRKNRNPDGSIVRHHSPASPPRPMVPRPDTIPRTTTYAVESSPEPADGFFFDPATPEYYQDAFMFNGLDDSQSPALSDTASFGSGWSNEASLMLGTTPDIFAPLPPFASPYSTCSGHVRSTSVQSQPDMFGPVDGHMYGLLDPVFARDRMMASPPPMVPAPLPSPPAHTCALEHDCTQSAFETLNSLYAPPPADWHGTCNGLPTLDTVLSTNMAAVDKLHVLLGCSCSANPHFSTTIALAIIKLLAWFQAIGDASRPHDECPVNTPLEAFLPPTPTLDGGKEEQEEDRFCSQVVLGELRRVEKLIDRFSDRYCGLANSAGTGMEGGLYCALETLLRTRVRDTFKVTMRSAPKKVRWQVASRSQNRGRVNTM